MIRHAETSSRENPGAGEQNRDHHTTPRHGCHKPDGLPPLRGRRRLRRRRGEHGAGRGVRGPGRVLRDAGDVRVGALP